MDPNRVLGFALLLAGLPALGVGLFMAPRISAAMTDALRGGGGLLVVAGAALAGGIVRWV